MAGLNRTQGSRFGLIVATILSFLGRGSTERARASAAGHPIARKYLRTLDPIRATGRDLSNVLYTHRGERVRRRAAEYRAMGWSVTDARLNAELDYPRPDRGVRHSWLRRKLDHFLYH